MPRKFEDTNALTPLSMQKNPLFPPANPPYKK
jgi:hypothetical protein